MRADADHFNASIGSVAPDCFEHQEELLRKHGATSLVVDLRNIYRADEMKKHRFAYTSVGRASTHQPIGIYTPLGQAESLTRALSEAVTTAP